MWITQLHRKVAQSKIIFTLLQVSVSLPKEVDVVHLQAKIQMTQERQSLGLFFTY